MFVNNGVDKKTCEYLSKSLGEDREKVTFTFEGGARHVKMLRDLFSYIQYLGAVGHSTDIKVGVDGDGAARIKVFEDGKQIEMSDELKNKLQDGDVKSGFYFD